MRLVRYVAHLWMTPSAFRSDWRKFVRNQIGHYGAVGLLPGLLLGVVAIPLVVVLYGLWELSQWQFRRASARDCIEDWGFVMSGVFAGAQLQFPVVLVAAAWLAAGALWRMEEAADG